MIPPTNAWLRGCRCGFCWTPIILAIGNALRDFCDAHALRSPRAKEKAK